ncbi:MAG: hypothetical protein IKS48_06090 [Eubacterium sp.]|nr:hypothetical protein [Eubacterium sp.]
MIQVVDNFGQVLRLGDLNIFGSGRVYLYNDQSTGIGLNAQWLRLVSGNYPVPTISLTEMFNDDVTTATLDLIDQQYLWLVGDAYHGGIAFYKLSGSSMGCTLVSTTDKSYFDVPVSTSGVLYLYDSIYVAGAEQHRSSFILTAGNNGHLEGERYTIIPPIPPEVIPTIEYHYSSTGIGATIPVQRDWNYLGGDTPVPTGIGINNTDSDEVTVGGSIGVGIHKSPWYAGDYGNIEKISWNALLEMVVPDPYDPTKEDPDTDPGGNGDIHDSIDIDFPELPPDMILGSGMIKVYVPSEQNLKDLTTWLYSRPDQIITNLKKIWANPMESIISLHIVPVVAPIGTTEEVKFCGIGTGISMPKLSTQYGTIDCGTLRLDKGDDVVPEEYKSFIDYGAFTRVKLYLPFIGIVDMSTGDVVGAQLHIKYNIDYFTGAVVAFVKSTKTNAGKKIRYDSVIYTFNGNFLLSAPITANNWGALYQSLVGSVTHIAQATIDPIGGASGMASDLISPKVNAQRSGNIVGGQGLLGEWTPYIIIERPPVQVPLNNPAYNGYMCNKYLLLGSCVGFTQVTDGTMRVSNTLATDKELQMIKEHLEAGVVF